MRSNQRPVPILGQQPSRDQAAKLEILQAINSLSLGIYSHLATAYIDGIDVHQDVSRKELRDLAKKSHLAAQSYFEGLGIITVESPS